MNGFNTIRELQSAIRTKQVSSTELTKDAIARLRKVGTAHNAVAEFTEDLALKQAARADDHPNDSVLNGIPYGAKDLLATKGIPTRWGSPGHADQIFDYDATVIARLEKAGCVLVAKLEMIELAGGGNYNVADASLKGPCLNAWDKKLWAGGSSSGTGASVGLGLVPFGIGSETAGSIVCPSAFNGVTGFRPTYGRVSRYGAMPLCWSLDRLGPLGRDAEDCGLVLDAISGHDPHDPSSLSQRLNLRHRGVRPKIGVFKEKFGPLAKQGQSAWEAALAALRKAGYETVEVEYPSMPYELAIQLIVDAEGASAHESYIRGPRFTMLKDQNQVGGFAAALEAKAVDYLWAMRLRTEALRCNAIWDKCDCVFTPAFNRRAVPIDQPFDKTWVDYGGDTGPSNLLGWPAICFPIGFDDGAPLDGQVIAPCMREDTCLRVARDYQRVTDHHMKRPTGAS